MTLLLAVLEEARTAGFLGPGAVEAHCEHAAAFAEAAGPPPERFLDLGSGGGVPGLVLALTWPGSQAVLLDARSRRCAFLRTACERLGIADRCSVAEGRAETLAHEPGLRGSFDLVVSRSFGPPAVTAEAAVGFLRPGGRLVVAEPPDAEAQLPERWPTNGLARLGLAPAALVRVRGTPLARLSCIGHPEPSWPRRVGVPAKRPLW